MLIEVKMSNKFDGPIFVSSWIIGLFVISVNEKKQKYTFFGDAKYPTAIKLSNHMSDAAPLENVKPEIRAIIISSELTTSGAEKSNVLEMMPLAATSRNQGIRVHEPVIHNNMFKFAKLLCRKYSQRELNEDMADKTLFVEVVKCLSDGMEALLGKKDTQVVSVGEWNTKFGLFGMEILDLMNEENFIEKDVFQSLRTAHLEKKVMGWLFLYSVIQTSMVGLSFHGGSISLLYREILSIGKFDISLDMLPAVLYVPDKIIPDCCSIHDFSICFETISEIETGNKGYCELENLNFTVLNGVRR